MENPDIVENPAIERQTSLPPALLEALDTDPEAMTPHYKKMLAVQAYRLHKLMGSKAIPVGQRVQVAEFFAKISGSDKKANVQPLTQSEKFSVNIIFNGKSNALPQVVDVKATEKIEEAADGKDQS
jgi:hypothetical protein